MPLVEDDDVIEKFSTKAANHAFNISVLPSRSRAVTTSSIPGLSILR
jgi:hypothetical protein